MGQIKDSNKITPNALKPLVVSAVNYLKKYKEFIKEIENPNFILKETSDGLRKGLKIIDEMKRDSQIGSDLRTRKGKIKGLQWSIQVDSEVESDKEQAKELKRLIEPVYRDLVTEIQEALEYGYAIVEKNWTEENGIITLPSVKGHDPANWVFDENGTPGLKTVENPEPTAVEMQRIIHATFDAPRGNPYGRSILIEAFWPWYWKKHCILFWSIFCEKFGQPTIVGWHAKGAEDEDITALLETLESIQSDTAVTLEDGWRIEYMEAKRTGTDSYKSFVEYCDNAITKAILSTTVTNDNKYGTYSKAKVDKDVTDEVLEGDSTRIQDIMTRDVVHPLALWNFKFTVPPKLYIHYDAKSVSKEEADGDEIQQRLMPIPLDDLYNKYGWTKPEGDSPVIFAGQITTWKAIMAGQANTEKPAFSKFSGEISDRTYKTNGTYEELSEELKEKDEALFLLKEGDYLDRVFDESKSRIDAAIDFNKIEKAFAGDSYSLALAGLDNAGFTDTQLVWEECLELAGCLAEFSVLHQVNRIPQQPGFSRFDKNDPLAGLNLVDLDYGNDAFRFIKPGEAISWFKNKLPVKKEVWDLLRKELKNHAFYLAKIDDLELVQRIKEEMLKSLEEGLTFRDFKKSLRDILDVKKLNTYLRTSFNTNMFSALSVENERALLRNTGMFPYWRYSALLDDRTTCDLCRSLHNFVAKYDHPAWGVITPPNHHNCKCRKVIATPAEVQQYLGRIVWNPENPSLRPPAGFDFNPAADNLERVFQRIIVEKQAQSLLLNSQIRQKESK